MNDILADYGIGVDSRSTMALRGDTAYVFMFDDAHERFDEIRFWGRLIANNAQSSASNMYFVVLTTRDPIPMRGWFGGLFCGLRALRREGFMLSEEEAHGYLDSQFGLPLSLSTPALKTVITHTCNELIGALNTSVQALTDHFSRQEPSEANAIGFYFTDEVLQTIAQRYFRIKFEACDQGHEHNQPVAEHNDAIEQILIKCLADGVVLFPRMRYCSGADTSASIASVRYFESLRSAGIVTEDVERGTLSFTSPLAKMFFCSQYYFASSRASISPTSPQSLIMSVLASMSASALQRAMVDDLDENELLGNATFQYLFLAGLAKHSTATCVIHSDIGKLLPPSVLQPPWPGSWSSSRDTVSKSSYASVGFYLSIPLHWGIELVRATDDHLDGFGPSGEYAILGVDDYIVVKTAVATTAETI